MGKEVTSKPVFAGGALRREYENMLKRAEAQLWAARNRTEDLTCRARVETLRQHFLQTFTGNRGDEE